MNDCSMYLHAAMLLNLFMLPILQLVVVCALLRGGMRVVGKAERAARRRESVVMDERAEVGRIE